MIDRVLWVAGLLVMMGLALLTSQRVAVWQSDATLWAAAVRVTPQKPRVLINAGNALVMEGHVNEGEALYLAALREAQDPRRSAESRRIDAGFAAENLLRARLRRR